MVRKWSTVPISLSYITPLLLGIPPVHGGARCPFPYPILPPYCSEFRRFTAYPTSTHLITLAQAERAALEVQRAEQQAMLESLRSQVGSPLCSLLYSDRGWGVGSPRPFPSSNCEAGRAHGVAWCVCGQPSLFPPVL
jgi:hypothetical protein